LKLGKNAARLVKAGFGTRVSGGCFSFLALVLKKALEDRIAVTNGAQYDGCAAHGTTSIA
jgi:hypothetical protein